MSSEDGRAPRAPGTATAALRRPSPRGLSANPTVPPAGSLVRSLWEDEGAHWAILSAVTAVAITALRLAGTPATGT